MAQWTTQYIDDLPDSAFLYVEAGGSKDSQGKTTPRSLRHFPYRDANGNVDMPHLRNALSRIPQSNLPQSVKDTVMAKAQRLMQENMNSRPPRENLVRAIMPGLELTRDVAAADKPARLRGHFAVFDQWSEIDSIWEGRFLERISPGAFSKTIAENRNSIKVLFQHGKDPQIGDKPLGQITDLREDDEGAYYEVDMFDTSYNRDLIPALEAGAYGASFRFRVIREDFDTTAEESDHNPLGLPERTIREAAVSEFGPVTFPAYAGATAGLRSITDDYIVTRLLDQPDRLAELIQHLRSAAQVGTEQEPEPEPPAPDDESADGVTGSVSRRKTGRELFLFTAAPAHMKESQ